MLRGLVKWIAGAISGLGLCLIFSTSAHAYVWNTAASNGPPIFHSSATLLRSGQILVAGGLTCCTNGYGNSFTSPAIFDPTTGAWKSAGGNITFARTDHTVTVLSSGKVLVVGGWTGYAEVTETLIYDPVADSWSNAASLNNARAGHTATLLSSGKVLVAGGWGNNCTTVSASAEIYDPATDTWTIVSNMTTSRYGHSATLLDSGKVLIAGGQNLTSSYFASTEIYDPQTDTWQSAASLPAAAFAHAAVRMPGGKVMVVGGFNVSGYQTSTFLYDPAVNTWSSLHAMNLSRASHTATLLPSGQVLVTGGEGGTCYDPKTQAYYSCIRNSVEFYDPVQNRWALGPSLNEARMQHSAVLLHSGAVAVVGGAQLSFANFQASLEILDTGTPSIFTSVVPARLLDTRSKAATIDGAYAGGGPLHGGAELKLSVTNRGGVPANGVVAVVLNVTVVNPTDLGFLTVWPSGSIRPLASNLDFEPNQTVPNLVVAKVGAGGQVSLFGSAAATDLVVDVVGWFPATSGFLPLQPARLLDTRPSQATYDGFFAGKGALGLNESIDLKVSGRAGIAPGALGSVLLNTIATNTTSTGYLVVWPQGHSLPLASNLNFVAQQTVPNLVLSQMGDAGEVSIFNSAFATDVVADIGGWFPGNSELTPLMPTRLLDTRVGMPTSDGQFAGSGAINEASTLKLQVSGRAGIPVSGVDSVVLNVTVANATTIGYLTVWPTGSPLPLASNLNFTPGSTVANLVFAKLGPDGSVSIFNGAGPTHVVADVVGWFPRSQ